MNSSRIDGAGAASLSRGEAQSQRFGTLAFSGCAFGIVGVFAVGTFLGYTDVDVWGAFVVPMLLSAFTLPVLSRIQWLRDERLFGLASIGLCVKFIGCYLRYLVEFFVYPGGDSILYHSGGARIAQDFLDGNRDLSSLIPTARGTEFIVEVNGLVSLISGRSHLASSMIFSWLAYIGLLCFVSALRISFLNIRVRTYAAALLLLPSLLFWTSALGKDSWMIFGMGVFCLGAAKLMGGLPQGLILATIGGYATALVRPHITALLLLGLGASLPGRWKGKGLVATAMALAVVLLLSSVVSAVSAKLLPGFEGGVTEVLALTAERTMIGGSSVEVSAPNSLASYPAALISVLMRPFLFEVSSLLALLSAVESTGIAAWLAWRYRAFRELSRRFFDVAYIRFSHLCAWIWIRMVSDRKSRNSSEAEDASPALSFDLSCHRRCRKRSEK